MNIKKVTVICTLITFFGFAMLYVIRILPEAINETEASLGASEVESRERITITVDPVLLLGTNKDDVHNRIEARSSEGNLKSYRIVGTGMYHLIPPISSEGLADLTRELLQAEREFPQDIEILTRLLLVAQRCVGIPNSKESKEYYEEGRIEQSNKLTAGGASNGEVLEWENSFYLRHDECAIIQNENPEFENIDSAVWSYAKKISDNGGWYGTQMLANGVFKPEKFDSLSVGDKQAYKADIGKNLSESRKSCEPSILRTLAYGQREGEFWTRPTSSATVGMQKLGDELLLGLVSKYNLDLDQKRMNKRYVHSRKLIEKYNLMPDQVAESEGVASYMFNTWCVDGVN
jgi:hypothetical protein